MENFRQLLRSYTREIYEIPISKFLIKLGLTPNMITFIGLIITIFGSYYIFQGDFLAGGIIVGLGTILDSIDGAMARLSNKESVFGDLLDSVIDRYGEATIFGQLNIDYTEINWNDQLKWGIIKEGIPLNKPYPIIQKLES